MEPLAAGYSDDAVRVVAMDMLEAKELGLLDTKNCCIIGAECSDIQIIPVAVHPGFESSPRNVDLYVDRYIEPEPRIQLGVIELDNLGSCIREFPTIYPRTQPFHWTIYRTDCSIRRKAPVPRNRLYDRLKGSDGNRTVYGNILVVKSNPIGVVCDVLERELFFVERLVCSHTENGSLFRKRAMLDNPLMDTFEGPSGISRPLPCTTTSNAMNLSPSFERIYQPDILSVIAFYLPWRSLLSWKHWPGLAPAISDTEARDRMGNVFAPYFPDLLMSSFFDLVENCRGAVLGSVVMELLLSGEGVKPKDGASRCLDIWVYAGLEDPFHTFFSDLGYVSHVESPSTRHGDMVETVEAYHRIEADGSITKVCVAISKGTVLEAMLALPTTSHLNAITNGLVLSFYPRLTWKNEALLLKEQPEDALEDPFDVNVVYGVSVTPSNDHWVRDCGIWCPMTRRKTYGDVGVAKYEWRVARLSEKEKREEERLLGWERPRKDRRNYDLTYHNALQLLVSDVCNNQKCSARELRSARARYVVV